MCYCTLCPSEYVCGYMGWALEDEEMKQAEQVFATKHSVTVNTGVEIVVQGNKE
jgi:hypothetical protein